MPAAVCRAVLPRRWKARCALGHLLKKHERAGDSEGLSPSEDAKKQDVEAAPVGVTDNKAPVLVDVPNDMSEKESTRLDPTEPVQPQAASEHGRAGAIQAASPAGFGMSAQQRLLSLRRALRTPQSAEKHNERDAKWAAAAAAHGVQALPVKVPFVTACCSQSPVSGVFSHLSE